MRGAAEDGPAGSRRIHGGGAGGQAGSAAGRGGTTGAAGQAGGGGTAGARCDRRARSAGTGGRGPRRHRWSGRGASAGAGGRGGSGGGNFCSMLAGMTSDVDHRPGVRARPGSRAAVDWRLIFTATMFDWQHSDVAESGTYTCSGNDGDGPALGGTNMCGTIRARVADPDLGLPRLHAPVARDPRIQDRRATRCCAREEARKRGRAGPDAAAASAGDPSIGPSPQPPEPAPREAPPPPRRQAPSQARVNGSRAAHERDARARPAAQTRSARPGAVARHRNHLFAFGWPGALRHPRPTSLTVSPFVSAGFFGLLAGPVGVAARPRRPSPAGGQPRRGAAGTDRPLPARHGVGGIHWSTARWPRSATSTCPTAAGSSA